MQVYCVCIGVYFMIKNEYYIHVCILVLLAICNNTRDTSVCMCERVCNVYSCIYIHYPFDVPKHRNNRLSSSSSVKVRVYCAMYNASRRRPFDKRAPQVDRVILYYTTNEWNRDQTSVDRRMQPCIYVIHVYK